MTTAGSGRAVGFSRLGWVMISLMFVSLAGCSDWWAGVGEVSGTVKIEGKPSKGVRVDFRPLAKDGSVATGISGANGVYRLRRLGPGAQSGAVSGEYSVHLSYDDGAANREPIPARFKGDSKLRFEVVSGKSNTFDIDASSQ